jgi:RHS repeat-associated protein
MAMPNRQIIGGQPYRYGYQGEFAETDPETGKPAFQLRLYDPRLNRWLSPDPMGQYASPYMSMGNNPVSRVDPDGGEDNPVYGANGEGFLGTTESGLQGEAIIMDAANFTQGMSDASALSAGTLFGDLNSFQNFKFMGSNYGHWKGLNQRPDWDGFVTPAEGVTWAKGHPGALQNPTANNSLYINSSLLDFGDVASANLSLGAITPVNLFSSANAKASIGNHTLRATVYALGRVNLKRVHGKLVKVINDDATDYDWNLGGSFKRRAAIRTERFLEGLNDTHGFRAFYYGLGRLNN